eukprot:m.152522 g.152522  ORF g.152522 m.152522 type:complete len:66 (-) comp13302_c1_seq6:530-727(-)
MTILFPQTCTEMTAMFEQVNVLNCVYLKPMEQQTDRCIHSHTLSTLSLSLILCLYGFFFVLTGAD